MKNYLLLLSAGLILASCQAPTTNDEAASDVAISSTVNETITVNIQVTVDGEEIEDGNRELKIEPGSFLLDVMKEHYDIVEEKTFITEIAGYKQDTEAGKYWLFDLNGEMAPTGAADTKLQEGDSVEWKLEAL